MLNPQVVDSTLAVALSKGGDFAEIFVEDRQATGTSLDDGKIEEMSSGRNRGAGIRVIVGETTGFAHTTDLSEEGLAKAAMAAAAVATRSPQGGTVSAGDVGGSGAGLREMEAGRFKGTYEPLLAKLSGREGRVILPESVPKSRKVELLRQADEIARAQGGAIAQVMAGYGDSRRRFLVANSDGVWAEDDQVRTRISVSCVAVGDAGMQTGYESVAETVGFELFEKVKVEEVAAAAADRALAKLNARPAPSGALPVVLKGGSGGILFHEACGHGLEADHIVKDSSVYAGKVGELVASPLVTLVDDGMMAGEWGNFLVDDEGMPAKRNVLIENGVLTDYMWDYVRGRKRGVPSGQGRGRGGAGLGSSGNGRRQSYEHLPMVRMTNTYLIAGSDDPDEIVAQTPRGVYVAKLGGGQVNTTTGDFVFGMVEAYLIEDGRITEPLRDANLIGNGPEVLRRIDAVAGDFSMSPGTCGKDGQSVPVGCGQPTLRITEVTIGGTAGA